MSRARSASTGRTCGRLSGAEGVGPATVDLQRAALPAPLPAAARRGPKTRSSDEDLMIEIRRNIQESPLHGEAHRKV